MVIPLLKINVIVTEKDLELSNKLSYTFDSPVHWAIEKSLAPLINKDSRVDIRLSIVTVYDKMRETVVYYGIIPTWVINIIGDNDFDFVKALPFKFDMELMEII